MIFFNNVDAIVSVKGIGCGGDNVPPLITLNGSDTVFVEVFGTYTEDGATAMDIVDGNLTNAIVLTGTIDTKVLGNYILNYTVKDFAGNSASKIRVVIIRDTQKPVITNIDANSNNEVKIQILSVFIDRTKVTDNYYKPVLVITPGSNGAVDTRFPGAYSVCYNAIDGSGNMAITNCYKYLVDDYIGPEINLKTADTILWPINTAYIAVEPTVKDNYYNTSQITLTKTSNVNAYKLGLYFDEYTATDGSGNVSVLRRYVKIVDAQAGIAVLEKNQGVNVYPNPSSGKFNIIYKSDLQEDLAIEVYNVTGKLVAVIKGDNGKNGIQTIDLSWEASGLYTIKISTNSRTIVRKVSVLK